MKALTFWKTITMDHANLLETLIAFLREQGVRFCVIGGQAVNAYVEPLVSLDLDLAVAVESFEDLERRLAERFQVRRFPHSLNVSLPGSDLRVQIQTDERYRSFVDNAIEVDVLGMRLPVARLEDVLRGKIWAALDPERRGSKRQKDLADIARLIEQYPYLRGQVPPEILAQLDMP
ncbi:MAG: nucleotidyl transferase AbiEii/AbiGii toxin family protein [Thermanaerothrix sp.]|uniref:nucleotidyl transferase AbiEii/AbiGii toxin family protein n=1 Tax=Thermanaerothrix sp. TaxID=2972675 RepID=UPI003C7A4C78